MPSYPLCVKCHSADSELDVAGECTTCSSRGSVRDTRADLPPEKPPRLWAFEPDATRTDADTPSPDRPRPPVTSRFPEYTDLQLIERGGMGIVYKATQVRTGRTVALKTMNVAAHGDGRQGRRFRTEAEALARLSHPGIVQIYEASERDGVPYLAMEYVPGGSLAKRLRAGPALSVREAAELAAGIASALAAAHARGITHRDVKPSNVLLTAAEKPKLTDFGLACLADATSRMTMPGSAIGTPAYMAPEQADAKAFGPVGPAADVYGLGATLYELLTGKPPFAGDAAAEILFKVCHTTVASPRTINPAIPPDLEAICLRCLEKQPADRFESVALVANALSRFLRGEPVGRPTLVFRAKKLTRRYGKVAAAGLAVSVLAGLMGAALVRDRGKPDPAAQASEIAIKNIMQRLKDGEDVELVPPGAIPKYFAWPFGATALSTNSTEGGDGSLVFQSTSTSLLELLPDTLGESFQVVAQLRPFSGGNPDGKVGVYLKTNPNQFMDRWQFVSFREFEDLPSRPQDGTTLKIEDRLILFCGPDPSLPRITHAQSEPYRPFGYGAKPYRELHIRVTPAGIDATILGLDSDRNDRTVRTASKPFSDSRFTEPDRKRIQDTIDGHPAGQGPSRCLGQPLLPMTARGSLGIAVENTSVAVMSVRVKLLSDPTTP